VGGGGGPDQLLRRASRIGPGERGADKRATSTSSRTRRRPRGAYESTRRAGVRASARVRRAARIEARIADEERLPTAGPAAGRPRTAPGFAPYRSRTDTITCRQLRRVEAVSGRGGDRDATLRRPRAAPMRITSLIDVARRGRSRACACPTARPRRVARALARESAFALEHGCAWGVQRGPVVHVVTSHSRGGEGNPHGSWLDFTPSGFRRRIYDQTLERLEAAGAAPRRQAQHVALASDGLIQVSTSGVPGVVRGFCAT